MTMRTKCGEASLRTACNMKSNGRTLRIPPLAGRLGLLAALLAARVFAASHADPGAHPTSIPVVAGIAGVKVGDSTREELEARLGPGKPITGGHPQGARLWRVKGTDWVIHADAFEYSNRGIVVDSLEIYQNPKPGRGIPCVRTGRKNLTWMGEVSLGMTEENTLKTLQRRAVPLTKTERGWTTKACGFCAAHNNVNFTKWEATLEFQNHVLNHISVTAQ
jgi:hypothetical protein